MFKDLAIRRLECTCMHRPHDSSESRRDPRIEYPSARTPAHIASRPEALKAHLSRPSHPPNPHAQNHDEKRTGRSVRCGVPVREPTQSARTLGLKRASAPSLQGLPPGSNFQVRGTGRRELRQRPRRVERPGGLLAIGWRDRGRLGDGSARRRCDLMTLITEYEDLGRNFSRGGLCAG